MELPDNYPDGCTPEQISAAIKEMRETIKKSGNAVNAVLQYSPLITMGVWEIERRENKKVVKETTIASVISLGIAIIALIVTFHGEYGNAKWEESQLSLLTTISKNEGVGEAIRDQNQILNTISSQLKTGIVCDLKKY